jgi:hypothetical protein
MAKGALPVPYIVALIIAIIVIAVLIYWFFIISGKPWEEFRKDQCTARAVAYCTTWAPTGYAYDEDGSPMLVGKWEEDKLGGEGCAKDGIITTVSKDYCQTLLAAKK